MSSHGRLTVCALLLGLAPAARGQTVAQMVESDIRNAVKDIVGVWISPYGASGRDWLMAAAVVGGSAALMPLDDNVDRWMVTHQNSSGWSVLKELREGGAAFTGKTVVPVAGVAYVIALATNNRDIRDGIFGCVSSYASGSILRNQVLYRLIGRERPDSSRKRVVIAPAADNDDQYDFDFPGGEWGIHSLPAGHAANIAACASFLNNRFSMGVVEPLLYALTAGVGVGRLVDRRHWTSDTVLGVIMGYAMGKEVARRSRARLDDDRAPTMTDGTPQSGFYLNPTPRGVTVGWQATFR